MHDADYSEHCCVLRLTVLGSGDGGGVGVAAEAARTNSVLSVVLVSNKWRSLIDPECDVQRLC